MMTDKFEMTLGIVPGYFHDNIPENNMEQFASVWQEAITKYWDEYGILVSVIIQPVLAIYPQRLGCPPVGEMIYKISGTRNPQYCVNWEAWRKAVNIICEEMRVHFKQKTAQLEFSDINMRYLKGE